MYFPEWFDGIMTFLLYGLLFIVIPYNKIPRIPTAVPVVIGILAVIFLGFAPPIEMVGTDRPTYAYMFSHADEYLKSGFRDVGFTYYLKLCDILTNSTTGGFVISACIYVFANFYFLRKSTPDRYVLMVLLCFLSLGFTNHYYNVLRSGLCISFLLIAFSKNQSKIKSVIFSLLAVSFHSSGLLVIAGYLVTHIFKKTKFLYLFWIIMLVALLVGIFDSFTQYIELFSSMEDERFNRYLSGNDRGYNTGLRLDFITYSLFPIVVGGYYIFKRNYKDEYYIHIYNTYLFCNACWLIFSKMPSNDRIAYLSWVFIPFLLLYPILNSTQNANVVIRNKKILMFVLISVIVGVNLFLKYIR